MTDREKVIEGQKQVILHLHRMSEVGYDGDVPYYEDLRDKAEDALELLQEQEPRVLTLDEAAAAQEVWVEALLRVPKKYVIKVTSLYLTDDCKNFELELLGTDKKAFMLAEAYGHTWRCWSAKPTDEQWKAVKWDAN